MARAFVTGVNGFIGSHLAEHLLERGQEVVGLVRPTSDLRSLQPLFRRYGERFRLVVGDLRTIEGLEAALDGVEYVYHLGAVIMGTSEAEFRTTNLDGTRRLLDAVMRRRGDVLRRFVFTSSQAAAGPSPSPSPIDETAPARPVSWYGASKRDAEAVVSHFAARGLPVTVVRPVAVYGEREMDISGGTFPAVRLGLLPRVGLREKAASFVYVRDLVRGMVEAATSPAAVGRTYFMANPVPNTASELVTAVADAMGKRIRIPLVIPHIALRLAAIPAEWAHHFSRARPMITRDKAREISQPHWAASPAAAQRDFAWVAATPLAVGMKAAVQDWNRRCEEEGQFTREPRRDRAIKTFSLAVLAGVLVEGLAYLARWYTYTPGWFILLAMFGFFGVVIGGISFFLAGRRLALQFAAGAAAFLAVEIPNNLWLQLWHFSPALLGDRDPWLRAVVLAIPVGLAPVLINALVGVLYRIRLRLG